MIGLKDVKDVSQSPKARIPFFYGLIIMMENSIFYFSNMKKSKTMKRKDNV